MYQPDEKRYDTMPYNRCGRSGLKLPAVSLGLWQNFGAQGVFANMQAIVHTAFDLGVTHFDLANNYGAPFNGSAEENFGRILRDMGHRDDLCLSTKAGYGMWPGPYGDQNGSRKYLIASLDQSLRRMGLEYVDIFYHHVYDPETPLEETALALDQIVRQGKALYVGVSNYRREQLAEILAIFRQLRTPFVVTQPSYSMLNRWVEEDGLDAFCLENGIGMAVFCPLQQGLLTDKYLRDIPAGSRANGNAPWIREQLDERLRRRLNELNDIARDRGQSLSQMALAWLLRNKAVTTVLTGASRPEHIAQNIRCVEKLSFTEAELAQIERVLTAD